MHATEQTKPGMTKNQQELVAQLVHFVNHGNKEMNDRGFPVHFSIVNPFRAPDRKGKRTKTRLVIGLNLTLPTLDINEYFEFHGKCGRSPKTRDQMLARFLDVTLDNLKQVTKKIEGIRADVHTE